MEISFDWNYSIHLENMIDILFFGQLLNIKLILDFYLRICVTTLHIKIFFKLREQVQVLQFKIQSCKN